MSITDHLKGILIFVIGGREFCLDIKEVYTVFNPADFNITAIQNHNSVRIKNETIKNLNVIIPLEYFHLKNQGISKDSRVIVCDNELQTGILVDKICEVVSVKDKNIEESIISVKSHENYISEIIEFEGRKLAVPTLKKLFRNGITQNSKTEYQDLINGVTRN